MLPSDDVGGSAFSAIIANRHVLSRFRGRRAHQLHLVRYPAQRWGDGGLGHGDAASAGNVAEAHRDPRLGRWPDLGQ